MLIFNKISITHSSDLEENIPQYIILHCTHNYSDFDSLLELHKNKFGWNGVGYHFFISNGIVYQARSMDWEGAHTLNFNKSSVGICIFSPYGSLSEKDRKIARELVSYIREEYGNLPVISHCQAQLKYFNKMLNSNQINIKFRDDTSIILNVNFEELKKAIESLNKYLIGYSDMKKEFLKFKNCPGEKFYDFLIGLNQN